VGRRVYLLRTGSPGAPPTNHATDLVGLRVGTDGRLKTIAGHFRLDAGGRRLTAPGGQVYPLARDPESGVLRIQRAGTLVSAQPAGGRCWIDDQEVGKAPRRECVAAGPHTVRVEGGNGVARATVDVPPDQALTISLGPR